MTNKNPKIMNQKNFGYVVFDCITIEEAIEFGKQVVDSAAIIIKPNTDGDYTFKAYGKVPTDWEPENVNCGMFQGEGDFENLKAQYNVSVKQN